MLNQGAEGQQPSLDLPIIMASSAPALPIVDFGKWRPLRSEQTGIAKQLREACQQYGFVYVKNHGVPQELVDRVFAISKRFFRLPMEEKMLSPHPPCKFHANASPTMKN